jgi:hypothetical protein
MWKFCLEQVVVFGSGVVPPEIQIGQWSIRTESRSPATAYVRTWYGKMTGKYVYRIQSCELRLAGTTALAGAVSHA